MSGPASRPVRHPKTLPKESPKHCNGSISESTICKLKKAAFRRRAIRIRSRIAEKSPNQATDNDGSGRRILNRAGCSLCHAVGRYSVVNCRGRRRDREVREQISGRAAPCKLTEQRRHLSASLYRFKSLTRALDRLVETINLIRERGLDPSANCNLAKGMLALFGNPI